jgi:hypothetical protein
MMMMIMMIMMMMIMIVATLWLAFVLFFSLLNPFGNHHLCSRLQISTLLKAAAVGKAGAYLGANSKSTAAHF